MRPLSADVPGGTLAKHVLKLVLALMIFVAGVAVYLFVSQDTGWANSLKPENLRGWITGLGPWGPVAVIGLMTAAILISPFPSAPIALASGAAYGHFWGAAYVAIGSEVGAIAAFLLARLLGRDLVSAWLGERLTQGLVGSQNALMGTVFFSRLLPFVSFDLVSYAAGLTVLSFWRFAIATFVGIVPASFLLAHFGGELASGEMSRIVWTSMILGVIVLIPLFLGFLRRE